MSANYNAVDATSARVLNKWIYEGFQDAARKTRSRAAKSIRLEEEDDDQRPGPDDSAGRVFDELEGHLVAQVDRLAGDGALVKDAVLDGLAGVFQEALRQAERKFRFVARSAAGHDDGGAAEVRSKSALSMLEKYLVGMVETWRARKELSDADVEVMRSTVGNAVRCFANWYDAKVNCATDRSDLELLPSTNDTFDEDEASEDLKSQQSSRPSAMPRKLGNAPQSTTEDITSRLQSLRLAIHPETSVQGFQPPVSIPETKLLSVCAGNEVDRPTAPATSTESFSKTVLELEKERKSRNKSYQKEAEEESEILRQLTASDHSATAMKLKVCESLEASKGILEEALSKIEILFMLARLREDVPDKDEQDQSPAVEEIEKLLLEVEGYAEKVYTSLTSVKSNWM